MTLFNQLKTEHREVIDIIKKIEKNGDKDGDKIKSLAKTLDIHMEGEERFFYPEMKEFPELTEEIVAAFEEHDAANKVLRKLRWMTYDEAGFKGRLKVLREMLEHHINEEEKMIFPKAEKVVTKEQLSEIKDNYMDYKKRKMSSIW